jgi:PAS domain S-box-containing protein
MALVSPQGKFLKVNPSLCGSIGYAAEELLEKSFQQITHPEDLEADLHCVRQMLDKQLHSYQMEKRYFHKNGSIIWVSLSVSLVWGSDNQPKFFISQIEDITARKKAEEQLKDSHRQLQELNKELHELRKGLLTICAWTKQIKVNEKWVPVERFLNETLGTAISHGISDGALTSMNKDIEQLKKELPQFEKDLPGYNAS